MSQPDFVHLHLHTQYSLLDGAIRLGDLIKKVKGYEMPAVAITDHGNMFGAIEFYTKCKDKGIKPIIGSEVYIAPGSRFSKESGNGHESTSSYHLVLLCQNLQGYRNLSWLVSAGYKEGFYYKPRIDKEILAEHSEGLIALSACLKGEVAYQCGRNRIEDAVATARWYSELFPGRYYIELQENTLPEQDVANKRLLEVASELSLPLVATNDCHYLNREDAKAHEVLLCIQTGKTMNDPNHMHFSAEEFYFKSPQEMAAAFHYAPEAIANTVRIAESCDFELDFKTYHFPQYIKPADKSLDDVLEEQAYEGLKDRLVAVRAKYPDLTADQEKGYYDRLRIELDCIKQMGFPGYFLIVADFINWAKDHGIPVGPGRGSAAGSLVAYSIRITDLDPIPYNLLFERFLNPERISMPDIDVDFCQDRREEVIQYVTEKYGRDKVCQIITFGTMAARGVLRDVGRALDMSYGDVDRIAKLVPEVLGITLEKALQQEPKLNELAEADPRIKELLDVALCLEGLARHASTHAAGVVVAPDVLEAFCPVYKDQKNGSITTQYSMKYVEKIGLVKFDFLGLKNLTVIHNAVKLIRAGKNADFDITVLRDDDEETYKLLQSGNTTGVFQLESSGMQGLLVKLKPSCFEDIIAVCALYRPGPLGSGMVDDFIDRKHGRKKVVYDLPQLEPILKDTYGVIVYQEQVMQISRVLAGYSLGQADLLRRAMGKKDPEVMAKEKIPFLAGAEKQNIDPKKAEAIFDLMAKFAEYGFNKSHSAAYALVAYQTAYLKTHYPVEFMAALLTEDMGSTDKVIKNISDCRDMGIEVLPPDINASDLSFRVLGNSIRFGLGAVKNVGESAIEAILEARKTGSFADIFDFGERVDQRKVNKRVVESLIKCGAFDSTGAKRAPLMAGLEDAMSLGQKIQQERESAQVSLFGVEEMTRGNGNGKGSLPDLPEWDDKFLLNQEKEALGFYITGHPLDRYSAQIRRFASVHTSDFAEIKDKAEVKICGIVVAKKEFITKKGDRMAFVTLEDLHGTVEVVVLAKVYSRVAECLAGDDPILVSGTVEVGEKNIKVIASDVVLLRELTERETRRVHVTVQSGIAREQLESLKGIIKRYPGSCRSYLHIVIPEQSRTTINLPDTCMLSASEDLSLEVKNLLGYNAVSFE
ncbi:DNA polymerase III, alpha subunit [Geotalea daltonii FRC-32]|uniref:DNA polymerase III subunit alpha n=1 Tax=Geotalea daltonii (strain DSM 22248 / JCM 15807 / FRC-32) TaxID=316067 RepID=B9M4V2_GEODF|nr:DNA polymerase III subunit alpha [Geotalea daltonii]ACM21636.1 DNA polymerase III, alpha subunit [Geotalea daltonii FRC-32]